MDVSILLATFAIVFTAEIIGDKSIYTISSLAVRFNTVAVFLGLSVAFCLKMFVAVLIGQVLTNLPPTLLATISAFTFLPPLLLYGLRNRTAIPPNNLPQTSPAQRQFLLLQFFY